MGEFILDYSDARNSEDPVDTVLAFLEDTYSAAADLAKWDRALESHALLGEAEMRVALTPVKLNDGSQPTAYGFGWFLDPFEGHPRMWHTGSTLGFRTVIERFTEEKLTIVILCNRTDLDPSQLALRAAQVFLSRRTDRRNGRME